MDFFDKVFKTFAGDKQQDANKSVDVENAKACHECGTLFSSAVPRHHCRICGRVFCSNCTKQTTPTGAEDNNDHTVLRLCHYCHHVRDRCAQSQDPGIALLANSAEQPFKGSSLSGGGSAPDTLTATSRQRSTNDLANTETMVPPAITPKHMFYHKLRNTFTTATLLARQPSMRSGATGDGALTWEVPPALDPSILDANKSAANQEEQVGEEAPLVTMVTVFRDAFSAACRSHLEILIAQLLAVEGVQAASVWQPIILDLAHTAANALSPAGTAACGVFDPRYYIKVKRVADVGQPADSCLVHGVVCKKNVAHRRMPTLVEYPKIIMLAGALEYQRLQKGLTSFDTMLEQEKEALRLAVDRIAALKPDVLLVEKSVARFAQEELLQRGIGLVLNVKSDMLDRLSRCMGTKVVPSLEALSQQAIAYCKQFRVETLPVPFHAVDGAGGNVSRRTSVDSSPSNSARTAAAPLPRNLMFFDGCPRPLGSTILLKGGGIEELTRLKRVVRFAILAAYHQRLESAFLSETMAVATAAVAVEDNKPIAPDLVRSITDTSVRASVDTTLGLDPPGLRLSVSPHISIWQSLGRPPYVPPPGAPTPQRRASQDLSMQGSPRGLDGFAEPRLSFSELAERPDAPGAGLALPGPVAAPMDRGMSAPATVGSETGSGSDSQGPSPDMQAVLRSRHASAEFTDPLRRATVDDTEVGLNPPAGSSQSGSPRGSLPETPEGAAVVSRPGAGLPRAPNPLDGLQLYHFQRIYVSIAFRNPKKGMLCEPHTVRRFDYYSPNDQSLVSFLVSCIPNPYKKCVYEPCSEATTAHVRTYIHDSWRITYSMATLPAAEALPGEERGQVWTWLRRKGQGPEPARYVRRLALSPEASCISFGQWLAIACGADHLELMGNSLNSEFVRYYGVGRLVACVHQDRIEAMALTLPSLQLSYAMPAQLKWLKQEVIELSQEANDAFDVAEASLEAHPQLQSSHSNSHGHNHGGSDNHRSTLRNQSALMQAVRKDRGNFIDQVVDCSKRSNPMMGSMSAGNGCPPLLWDEQVAAGAAQLNRLRRKLSIALLSWAAVLQEPSFFSYVQSRMEGGLTTFQSSHSSPATANFLDMTPLLQQRVGVSYAAFDESGGGGAGEQAPGHAAAPIVPALGPISISAVADFLTGVGKNSADLLEGGKGLMMAGVDPWSVNNDSMKSHQGIELEELGAKVEETDTPNPSPEHSHTGIPAGPHMATLPEAEQLTDSVEVSDGTNGSLSQLASRVASQEGVFPLPSRHPTGLQLGHQDDDEDEQLPGNFISWLSNRKVMENVSLEDGDELYPGALPEDPGSQRVSLEGSSPGVLVVLESPSALLTSDQPSPSAAPAGAMVEVGSVGQAGQSHWPASSEPGMGLPELTTAASTLVSEPSLGSLAEQASSAPRSIPASTPGRSLPSGAEQHDELYRRLLEVEQCADSLPGSGERSRGSPRPGNHLGAERDDSGMEDALRLEASDKHIMERKARHRVHQRMMHGADGPPISKIYLPGRALLPAGIDNMVVPIFDNEPTSIVAHFLATPAYQQMLNTAMRVLMSEGRKAPHPPGSADTPADADWLALLCSREKAHISHEFVDDSPGMPWAKCRFQVVAYFAPQFAELRRRCIMGGETAFIASLCRCRRWGARGGKSNAYFAKTRDDRYIIKTLSKPEKNGFLEFAPAYFEHLAVALRGGRQTTLAKILGVFTIEMKNVGGGGKLALFKDGSIDVLVMENLFYDKQITRIYDLKGSERARFSQEAAANPTDAGAVHLDDNLRRHAQTTPILVSAASLKTLEAALWADTAFLAGLGVMDYSLLVGVEKENNQLIVGLIDYVRQYTWDKQLETWVKSSGILGGGGKEPTIISPTHYMRRFRTAMNTYFTVVPNAAEIETPMDPELS